MFFGGSFFWLIVLFPVALIAGLLLIVILCAATGFSFLDLLSVLFGTGARLTCWHCGQETPADRKRCRHCGKELQ